MPKMNTYPAAASIDDTDVFVKEEADGTRTEKVTALQLANYAKSKGANVDATLTRAGVPADAKAAGDAVADLKSALNYNKTATPGYILRATNDGTGQEWAQVGTPTDAQTAQAVAEWLGAHPEATTTVLDGAITEPKLAQGLLSVLKYKRTIEAEGGFENAVKSSVLGTYVGNDMCELDSSIDLTDVNVANHIKIFANTAFNLHADMFTWTSETKTIPSFVNCVFYGNGHNIVADGIYPLRARFINCVFYQCGFVNGCSYVQSIRFIGCRFIGDNDIISGGGCSDIVFDECQAEGDFHASFLNIAATGKYALDRASFKNCVIESNSLKEIIKVSRCAAIDIDGCYFEAYSNGIFTATQALTGDFIILSITNSKIYRCGDPFITIATSYSSDNLKIAFKSCIIGTRTDETQRDLMNRYDMDYTTIDCEFGNVSGEKTAQQMAWELVGLVSPEMHRNIYRGKNLGTALTDAQKTAIQNGTFDDLYIGDYWIINGTRYDIADMDYWYNCGDTAFTKHHLVMIPHGNMYTAKMNPTNTTVGAYYGSAMYTGVYTDSADEPGLTQARTKIAADFGANLLTHRIILSTAMKDGYANGYAWFDTTADLMSEKMVYGTQIYSAMPDGITIPVQYTSEKTQLAIFRLNPMAINTRENYWLRDIVNSTIFAMVANTGMAGLTGASNLSGVRPAFAVGV